MKESVCAMKKIFLALGFNTSYSKISPCWNNLKTGPLGQIYCGLESYMNINEAEKRK